jgi:hypothetical protein
MIVAWFCFVDWVWTIDLCPDCSTHKSVQRYRLFRIPIHSNIVSDMVSALAHALEDLGWPCEHTNRREHLKYRRRGLFWNTITVHRHYTVGSGEAYTQAHTRALKSMQLEDPRMGEKLYRTLIEEHDIMYWREVTREMNRRIKEEAATE